MNKLSAIVSSLALFVAFTTLGLVLNVSIRLEEQAVSIRDAIFKNADRTGKLFGDVGSSVQTGLDTIGAKVEQQSMLVNRALGKVIPLVLPADIQDEMKDIESQLSDESKWPKEASEIQALNERLANVVNSLPPWAQEELLPRLLPRRWEIDSLWFLANSKEATESNRIDQASAVEVLLSQKSSSASEQIADKLRERQQEILTDIRLQEKAAAISAAQEALDGEGDYDIAIRMLRACEEDADITELANRMQVELIRQGLLKEMDNIQRLLDFADTAESRTKVYALDRAEQMIADIRIRMGALSHPDSSLFDRIDGLQRKAETGRRDIIAAKQRKDAESVRAYQIWALEQIQQVQEYDKVVKDETAKIAGRVDRANPLSEERAEASQRASATIRDELIDHMGPINQGVLDEAVNQLFRKVYQSRFDKLSKVDQFEVIKGFAVAEKRGVEFSNE